MNAIAKYRAAVPAAALMFALFGQAGVVPINVASEAAMECE